MKIRRYFRQPLIQAALLKLPNSASIPCEIRNFCQAGLLLKPTGSFVPENIPLGQDNAEVAFTAIKTETTFRLTGKLIHTSASGLGFVFEQAPCFQILQALQEQALPNPLVERKIPEALVNIHEQCVRALENFLYPIVDKLPVQICAELAKRPHKAAGSPVDPSQAHWEKSAFEPLVEQFYAHALEQAKSFVVPDLSLQPEPGAVYTELRQQRILFDDWMNLIDNIVRLETKYEASLRLLESRFSVLVQRDIVNHNNPFGPNVLCHSFHYTLQGSGLGNYQRNIIYEVFTRLLDECLGKLYGDLRIVGKSLDILIKSDFSSPPPLPCVDDEVETPAPATQIPDKPKAEPAKPKVEWSLVDLEASEPPAPPPPPEPSVPVKSIPIPLPPPKNDGIPDRPDAFTAFVVLFRYTASLANKESSDAASDSDHAVIVAALQKLQAGNASPAALYFSGPKLRTSLSQILAETGQENILNNSDIWESLQILGLLLDAILTDIGIPTGLYPYFKRLQIPLLIASFSDPQIIYAKTHPAREILNQLDLLAQAANSQGNIDNAELVKSLNSLFERIANEIGNNPEIFVEGLASLKKLTFPQVKAYGLRLDRVAEACEGGQRLEHARRLVEREIGTRLGGKTVPSVILALLDIGWRQILVLTVLRVGVNHEDWRRQIAVIDLLMGWLSKKTQGQDMSSFNPSNVEWLVQAIREGLSSIGTTQGEIQQLLEKIDSLLPNTNGNEPSHVPVYVKIPPLNCEGEERESIYRERLQGFRVGEWLKFSLARGSSMPLRLTWIGENPARYVFVNRKGIKALDLDALKFIKYLDEKRASRIENLDECSLVERAAKSLLPSLRDRLR